jgi:hypothetical protein
MLPRSTQAASHICFSKPMSAVVFGMEEYFPPNIYFIVPILPHIYVPGNSYFPAQSAQLHPPNLVYYACCYLVTLTVICAVRRSLHHNFVEGQVSYYG